MKLVYIAGPYGGADYLAIDRNIAAAREVAAALADARIGFVCPHLNSAHFEAVTPDVPEEWWKALDLEILGRCDAILLIDGWSQSDGAEGEARHASGLGLPVFEITEQAGERERFLKWAAE